MRLEMDGKVFDSSSHGNSHSRHDRERAWSQLTIAYLQDLLRQLDEIIALQAAADYGAIARHAHRARGTSGTYHLNSIAKMFTHLEQLAQERDRGGIAVTVEKTRSLVQAEIHERNQPERHPTDTLERNTNG